MPEGYYATQLHDTEVCDHVDEEDNCVLIGSANQQPPGWAVEQAKADNKDGTPWCIIWNEAWAIAAPEEDDDYK